MLKCPNMVMVGAATRNVGKTEFCCALIRKQAQTGSVVGIKITPSSGLDNGSSFLITEECGTSTDKDTKRMLDNGAEKVFWLRAPRENLNKAAPELLHRIPEGTCIVCESTSLRTVVEPGAFLIIRPENSTEMKPSCEQVIGMAERIALFHGDGWDLSPESLSFNDGHWTFSAGGHDA